MEKITGTDYQQRALSQLDHWADGNSFHNIIDDECCPDFSCCNKMMDTPIAKRQLHRDKFKAGEYEFCEAQCFEFLSEALTKKGFKVTTSRPQKHFEDDGAHAD